MHDICTLYPITPRCCHSEQREESLWETLHEVYPACANAAGTGELVEGFRVTTLMCQSLEVRFSEGGTDL